MLSEWIAAWIVLHGVAYAVPPVRAMFREIPKPARKTPTSSTNERRSTGAAMRTEPLKVDRNTKRRR